MVLSTHNSKRRNKNKNKKPSMIQCNFCGFINHYTNSRNKSVPYGATCYERKFMRGVADTTSRFAPTKWFCPSHTQALESLEEMDRIFDQKVQETPERVEYWQARAENAEDCYRTNFAHRSMSCREKYDKLCKLLNGVLDFEFNFYQELLKEERKREEEERKKRGENEEEEQQPLNRTQSLEAYEDGLYSTMADYQLSLTSKERIIYKMVKSLMRRKVYASFQDLVLMALKKYLKLSIN